MDTSAAISTRAKMQVQEVKDNSTGNPPVRYGQGQVPGRTDVLRGLHPC